MPHLQMRCGQPMQVPLVCASSVQAKHTSMHAGYAASCQSHATAHTCIHMYPSFYMHTACATVNMMSSCEGVQSFMHITTNCTVQPRRPNQLCVYTSEMISLLPSQTSLSDGEHTGQAQDQCDEWWRGQGQYRHKNHPIKSIVYKPKCASFSVSTHCSSLVPRLSCPCTRAWERGYHCSRAISQLVVMRIF